MTVVLYAPLLFYSLLCAPDVWFRLFKYRDGPEYAFLYVFGVIVLGFSLLGAAGRVGFAVYDAFRGEQP